MNLRIEDGVPYVGDRSFPWASKVRYDDIDLTGGTMYRSRGFWLTFDNGWTLSVQFGQGNYCENYGYGLRDDVWHEECPDAEIAAWWGNGDMIEWAESGDTVLGRQTAEQVLAWIDDFSTRASEGVRV